MSHPYVHAKNSAKLFGGKPEDYLFIHQWFDETKAWCATMTHRAMRHHSEGIFECERLFGESFINSEGKTVFTRYVGEQHVREDLTFIPTANDWLSCMDLEMWMMNRSSKIKEIINRKKTDNLPISLSDNLNNN